MIVMAHAFLLGIISVGLLFFLMWVIHLFIKNAGIVDVGWGLGFILLCVEYIMCGHGFNLRNTICLLMICLWGIRIVLYLFKRFAAENKEDKRYAKMRQEFGSMAGFKFLLVFEFQAVLEMIIGIPLLIISFNPHPGLSIVEILGTVLFAIALIGETIADHQLFVFKSNSSNKGRTCNAGLWQYSRHPNYFFEWLVWVAFFVYALGSPLGWFAVISPLFMFYLLIFVSGVPLAEQQSLQSRGEEYRKYQQTTSMFIPWPRKGINQDV